MDYIYVVNDEFGVTAWTSAGGVRMNVRQYIVELEGIPVKVWEYTPITVVSPGEPVHGPTLGSGAHCITVKALSGMVPPTIADSV